MMLSFLTKFLLISYTCVHYGQQTMKVAIVQAADSVYVSITGSNEHVSNMKFR